MSDTYQDFAPKISAELPYEVRAEERARELAARDLVIQRAMSIIGLKDITLTELKQPIGSNENTEKA